MTNSANKGRSTNDENSQPEKLYYTYRQDDVLCELRADARLFKSVKASDYPPPALTLDEKKAIDRKEYSCSLAELAMLPIFTAAEEQMLANVRAKIKKGKGDDYDRLEKDFKDLKLELEEKCRYIKCLEFEQGMLRWKNDRRFKELEELVCILEKRVSTIDQ